MYNCPAMEIYQYSHVEKCHHFFQQKQTPFIYILQHRSISYAENIYICLYIIIICYVYMYYNWPPNIKNFTDNVDHVIRLPQDFFLESLVN